MRVSNWRLMAVMLAAAVILGTGAAACAFASQHPDGWKPEIPHYVDLMRYTGRDAASGSDCDSARVGIKVFGWSNTGNFAYMRGPMCSAHSDWFYYDVVIKSMVTDRVVFSLRVNSKDYGAGKTFKQLYAAKRKEIEAALEKHGIVERWVDFWKFPLKTGKSEYRCGLKQVGETTNYNIVIGKDGKETKKIGTVSSDDNVYVCGYFLSRFKSGIMAVVTAKPDPHGGNYEFSFSGCDLEKGFAYNEKLERETEKAKEIKKTASYFTDNRDGREYRAVRTGGKKWMAENLKVDAVNNRCYGNMEFNCHYYGRLYDWGTAMKACPAGWRLPMDNEWDELVKAAGSDELGEAGKQLDGDIAGRKLKSETGWNNGGNGTDDYGFSALPGGGGDPDGSFDGAGNAGVWWTATAADATVSDRESYYRDNKVGEYPGRAYYRGMSYRDNKLEGYSSRKNDLFSVRCVEDN